MAIESNVKTIADFDNTLPAKSDYISEGDDHLRLIKHTLQQTFPNANDQLTSEFSELSKTTEYMDFKRDSNDSFNIIEFKELTQVKNAGNATDDKDLVTLGQLNEIITSAIKDRFYPVGSYWISEVDRDPRVVLQLPGTVWKRVTGFLAGIGNTAAGGDNYSFVGKGRDDDSLNGATSTKLTESQIPRIGIDGSAYTTSNTSQTFQTTLGAFKANGNSSGGELAGQLGNSNETHTFDSTATNHAHVIQGTAYIGHDAAQQVGVPLIPPHRGVYIWRRYS